MSRIGPEGAAQRRKTRSGFEQARLRKFRETIDTSHFSSASPNPRTRRAFAHAQVSGYRAGEATYDEAIAAVAAVFPTQKGARSGLDDALWNSFHRREERQPYAVEEVQPRVTPGEKLFRPLLTAQEAGQQLSPNEERALSIRAQILRITHSALSLDSTALPPSEGPSLVSEIQDAAQALVGLGVTPGMHLEKPLEIVESDPLLAAQYAGGQELDILRVSVPDSDQVFPETTPRVEIDTTYIPFIVGTSGRAHYMLGGVLG